VTGILPDCALQDRKSVAVLWWATQHPAVNEKVILLKESKIDIKE
jgi:hypothetical protein